MGGAESGSPAAGGSLVVGSQQYYSNEIIAELYAQALEAEGYQVTREFQIGQREVYLPEMEDGRIDLLPEYNGNLLQYYDAESTARTPEQVTAALAGVLPDGIRPLEMAEATDQDSYTVTQATADEYDLTEIGDLANLPQPVRIAANSEFATRPYGIPGLLEVYGVQGELVPIEDSGSALTVKALVDGDVEVATSTCAGQTNNLVSLADRSADPAAERGADRPTRSMSGPRDHQRGQRATGCDDDLAEFPQRGRTTRLGHHRDRVVAGEGDDLVDAIEILRDSF